MKKTNSKAGLAIGPIIFIIALLALLAAAIAGGSSSFRTTGTESNKTKSSTLVQIGETLKMGMDKIVTEVSISAALVDFNVAHTTENNQLFSPTGGSIPPPSIGMAADPLHDEWYFPQGKPDGFGGGSGNVIFAVLPVTRGVCAEVNNRSIGVAAVPPAATLGDFGTNKVTSGAPWPVAGNTWTAGATTATTDAPTLVGVLKGCVWNNSLTATIASNCSDVTAEGMGSGCSTGPTSPFFFYQVMAIQ